MIKWAIGLLIAVAWIFFLRILRRAGLNFWEFLVGSAGMFILLMIFAEPVLVQPLSRVVALLASLPGKIGNIYQAYYKYSTIFIQSEVGAISMKIDFECSGVIEIFAYLSLLAFFKVYTPAERVWVGILGTIGIIFANALRIVTICLILYFCGLDMYYIAHTFIGRIVFYAFSVTLYFYVFTKPQIVRQKVGLFRYDNH